MSNFAELENALNYTFRDSQLLVQALTHCSCALTTHQHNQRLEFLGDAILGLLVAEELYTRLPTKPEGVLTEIKAQIVSGASLAESLRTFNVRPFIRAARGVAVSGNNECDFPVSLYADVCEALIAAIYLDGGLAAARAVILRLLGDKIDRAIAAPRRKNCKSALQEWAQRTHGLKVSYKVLTCAGPQHRQHFQVAAYLNDEVVGLGDGANKKIAEQAAAQMAVDNLIQNYVCRERDLSVPFFEEIK